MRLAIRLLKGLPLLVLSPILVLIPWILLSLTDLLRLLLGRRRANDDTLPNNTAASIVIPNWNGRDLLEKYIPSILIATGANPRNEIIVVDDASTDGSVDFLRTTFPSVRVIANKKNLGFGGGSNAGFRAAKNDIVVLLNSDMRVNPDFLAPLLNGFTDPRVFAVSCQIFFSDPNKLREETGLTQAWWSQGKLGVRHRNDDAVADLYPCFYGGGGSCAFDRRKFLELGGFDHILAPFYLEDTDLGFMAWKRGWQVLYQPKSIVWHEHRGTIGKRFSQEYIQSILHKNFVLFAWKNIHEWPRFTGHFIHALADAILSYFAGESPQRATLAGLARAFLQLPQAIAARWRARSLAQVSDTEAFRRPLGGYFRDRFHTMPAEPEDLSVLMLSPYPIYPPTHGGGVFMYGTAKALACRTRLHIAVVLDEDWQIEQHDPLTRICASASFIIRPDSHEFAFGSIIPNAVREFMNADLDWAIHRTIYLHKVDVVQLEYTNMGHYLGDYRHIVQTLFEHDVYFQSIGRGLKQGGFAFRKLSATFEYLRALRWELRMLSKPDQVQTCSAENTKHLLSFRPALAGRIDDTLRAGIDTSAYSFVQQDREPFTMLFLGSFRHLPNQEALDWFVKHVLPKVTDRQPEARLVIIGSDPPPRHSLPVGDQHIEIRGFVEDLAEPFARYAVFVCPILSGSGVRVKLLEAFCTGIPVVSTVIGAEGLTHNDGEICRLADDPQAFADAIVDLFENPATANDMVCRARKYVTQHRDITGMTERLLAGYKALVQRKR